MGLRDIQRAARKQMVGKNVLFSPNKNFRKIQYTSKVFFAPGIKNDTFLSTFVPQNLTCMSILRFLKTQKGWMQLEFLKFCVSKICLKTQRLTHFLYPYGPVLKVYYEHIVAESTFEAGSTSYMTSKN